jgi:HAUS augmin-like complex subunit 1
MQASPSKARAQAAESHSWSVVLSWLANLYQPSTAPSFERNANTLRALQALMAENVAADRLAELLFEAKREGLALTEQAEKQEREAPSGPGRTLALLEDSLSDHAKESLGSLASSAVALGCSSTSGHQVLRTLPSQIVWLSRQTFALEDHITSIETLTANLEAETSRTKEVLSAFRQKTASMSNLERDSAEYQPSTPPRLFVDAGADYSHLHAQTLQNQREMKQLELKSAEYMSRIHTLEQQLALMQSTSVNAPTTTTLVAKQRELDQKRKHVEDLEAKFMAFHGLPPDIEASRQEVRRAQGDLDALKKRRDELFERM